MPLALLIGLLLAGAGAAIAFAAVVTVTDSRTPAPVAEHARRTSAARVAVVLACVAVVGAGVLAVVGPALATIQGL
jgi:hypothetical protein